MTPQQRDRPLPTPSPSSSWLEEAARFLSDRRLDGRAPGTEGHRLAAEYLLGKMRTLGLVPLFKGSFQQEVLGYTRPLGTNLCGFFPGKTERKILICAHYDHFAGIAGADDNAAALAIALEAGRRLQGWKGRASVVFCFFDLEEPPNFLQPTMGSNFFAANCPFDLSDIVCALVMDLCGHDLPIAGAENALIATGAEYRQFLLEAVQQASTAALPLLPVRNDRVGDLSDHHAFRVRGIPFLFLSCGWWEHYHKATDTFEKLSLGKMERIVETLLSLVRHLDSLAAGTGTRWESPPDFERYEALSAGRLLGSHIPAEERALQEATTRIIGMLAGGVPR
jgi:hypothetical protein